MRIEAGITDLNREPGGGWVANGCYIKRIEIDLPDTISDLEVTRRIKLALGIQSWERDEWSGAKWSWRRGILGAWADVA